MSVKVDGRNYLDTASRGNVKGQRDIALGDTFFASRDTLEGTFLRRNENEAPEVSPTTHVLMILNRTYAEFPGERLKLQILIPLTI